MKRKQLKKLFVQKKVCYSVKQRPLSYKNLPGRTKLISIRYIDDQNNMLCKYKNNLKIKRK